MEPRLNAYLDSAFDPAGSEERKKPRAMSQKRVCEGDDTKVNSRSCGVIHKSCEAWTTFVRSGCTITSEERVRQPDAWMF